MSGWLPSRRGFTVIEVIVAAGLLVVVAAVMLGVLRSVLGVWNASTDRMLADQEARLVLQLLAEDLQSILRSEETTIVAIPRNTDFGVVTQLRMYSTVFDRDRSVAGDVNAVIYHTDDPEDESYPRRLYRVVVDSATVFHEWFGDDAGLERSVAAFYGGVPRDARAARVVDSLLDFEVRFRNSDATGSIDAAFHPDHDGIIRIGGTRHSAAYPRSVSIRMTVLTGTGRRLVAAAQREGVPPPPAAELSRRYGITYHRLIALR